MNESYLRGWLLSVAGRENVEWVDPTARTVGVPDCRVCLSVDKIPVELKFWDMRKNYKRRECRKKKEYSLRPAQWNYHRRLLEKGERSAILFATPRRNDWNVWRAPIRDIEVGIISFKNYYEHYFNSDLIFNPPATYLYEDELNALTRDKKEWCREKLMKTLLSEDFWM